MNSAIGTVLIGDSTIHMSPFENFTESLAISSIFITVLNSTKLSCPAGFEIFSTGAGRGCRICQETSYNLKESIQIDSNSVEYTCLPCPFAALCHKDIVLSSQGYWGAASINGSVELTYCPGNYCCDLDYCSPFNKCSGHRNGTLCGECNTGFVESISSTECVEISDRCSSSLLWFIPISFLIGICISIYFLSRSKDNTGLINIILYFYQGAGLILLQQQTSTAQSLQSILFDLFSFQMGVAGGSAICISNTLTAVTKQVFYIISPIFILFPLGLLILILKIGCSHNSRCYGLFHSASIRIQSNYAIIHSLLRVCLFMYSSIVLRLSNLLHCISISNIENIRLFRAAYIECYQPWQHFSFMILGIVLIIPLISLWYLKQKQNKLKTFADLDSEPNNSVTTGQIVYLLLASPYKHQYSYWENILLIWRLYMVLISTFITMPTSVLLYFWFGNFVIFALQIVLQPFKDIRAQLLQTLCLTGLVLMSLLGLPKAFLISAGASSTDKPIHHIIQICQVLQLLILLLPIIVLFGFGIQYLYCYLKLKSRVDGNIQTHQNNDNQETVLMNPIQVNNEINANSDYKRTSLITSDSYTELKD